MQARPVHIIPEETLLHLYTRFLLNIPDELKREWSKDFVRIFFEIECAHWFYVDYCIEDPAIGGVDMFGLAQQIFERFPHLVPKNVVWQDKFKEWKKYRGSTSTGHAVIIDEYYKMILLIQGFYGNRWNLPGGKVNQNESLVECASREVMEETGLDIENRILPSVYIDRYIGGALRRAFIIEGLPRTSRLKPGTRNEIEAITWFEVADLPTHMHDTTPIEKLKTRPNKFYLVIPYVKQIQIYIDLRKSGLPPVDSLRQSQLMWDQFSQGKPQYSYNSMPPASQVKPVVTPHRTRNRSKRHSSSTNANTSSTEKTKPTESSIAINNKLNLELLQCHDVGQSNLNGSFNAPCWQSVRIDSAKMLEWLCGNVK